MNVELVDNITGKLCFAAMRSLAWEPCLLPIRAPLCCQLFCSYRLQSAGRFHSRVATSGGKRNVATHCSKAQVFPSGWDGFRLLFLLVPRLSIWLGSICTYFSFIFRSFLRTECMNIIFALFWSYSFLLTPSISPHSSNSWWPPLLFIFTLTDIPGETDTEIERDTILTYMYIYISTTCWMHLVLFICIFLAVLLVLDSLVRRATFLALHPPILTFSFFPIFRECAVCWEFPFASALSPCLWPPVFYSFTWLLTRLWLGTETDSCTLPSSRP